MDDKPTLPRAIFQAAPLKPEMARRAYPLVRLFNPTMELADWLTYARSFGRNAAKAGLQVLEDERGYVHAVFAYSVRQHLRHRKLLRVYDVVMAHLPGRTLAETMLDAIAVIAKDNGCDSVMVEIDEASPAREALRRAGFEQTEIACYLADHSLQLTELAS